VVLHSESCKPLQASVHGRRRCLRRPDCSLLALLRIVRRQTLACKLLRRHDRELLCRSGRLGLLFDAPENGVSIGVIESQCLIKPAVCELNQEVAYHNMIKCQARLPPRLDLFVECQESLSIKEHDLSLGTFLFFGSSRSQPKKSRFLTFKARMSKKPRQTKTQDT
jgi:hypothetical protein